MVAFFDAQFLPPMQAWYSGLMPFGYVYLAAMVARFLWFGPSIPVVFHWVLAAFVITVGLSHRGRLR